MEDVGHKVREAQSRVSRTITALEAAISTWDSMEKKPEEHAEIVSDMRRLLAKLETWERKSLKNRSPGPEEGRKELRELIAISDSFKGDF
ncbi:MAG: hypothetical protein AB1324_02315 [Candidatus Micrarchaeota archaeon]